MAFPGSRSVRALGAATLLGLVALASGLTAPRAALAAPGGYVLQEAWPGTAFAAPIDIAAVRDGSDRVFIAQRGGKILVVKKNRGGAAVAAPTVFLDLTSLQMPPDVLENGQGGLLSIAFPADFKTSGLFAVYYGTGTGTPADAFRGVLATYRVSAANPDVADPASAQMILTIPKVSATHFGGGLCFAADGTLYVGLGESAMTDDPKRIAQDTRELQGKILRLDVSGATKPYGIPADNPWAKALPPSVRPEIFAYGVRNPWRMRFDSATGQLWLGDPGQKKREEIDVVPRGGNMGWAMMEADLKLAPDADPSKYVAPVFAYGRELGKCAIGGVVYHGQRCPALAGKYVFADNSTGVFGLPVANGRSTGGVEKLCEGEGIVSIVEDAQGELLLASLDDNKVFTLVPAP